MRRSNSSIKRCVVTISMRRHCRACVLAVTIVVEEASLVTGSESDTYRGAKMSRRSKPTERNNKQLRGRPVRSSRPSSARPQLHLTKQEKSNLVSCAAEAKRTEGAHGKMEARQSVESTT